MSRVFLGMGSNLGDRLLHLSDAARQIAAIPGVQLQQMASIYETEPVGGPPQEPYLNTVLELDVTCSPRDLLRALQALERTLGRVPTTVRWGPRPIDLDILLFGDLVQQEPDLIIPHPRLHERRFALEPLAQLAPDLLHPLLKRSIAELLSALPAEPEAVE